MTLTENGDTMLIKIIIILLLIAIVISLSSGLVFLFKDGGSTKRTLHSLGVRISLAVTLIAVIVYGVLSGQLKIGAPWDQRKFSPAATSSTQTITPEQSSQDKTTQQQTPQE